MKIVMAKTAVDYLRHYDADRSAKEAVKILSERTHGTGGLILLNREGNPGFAFNTPRLAYGYVSSDGSFLTGV